VGSALSRVERSGGTVVYIARCRSKTLTFTETGSDKKSAVTTGGLDAVILVLLPQRARHGHSQKPSWYCDRGEAPASIIEQERRPSDQRLKHFNDALRNQSRRSEATAKKTSPS
jgi:hypothetical protein